MTHQLPDLHHHIHHNHQQQQRRAVDLRIPAIEKYAYCLCLHVKPTTIFIAVFKLIRALLFASILLNTEFSNEQAINDLNLASIDDRHRSTAAAVNILTRIIMASVSAVAIYAVISGRAALLMPLYAMLLVDFFFALPAFYNRELDSSFSDSVTDFKNYSSGSNQYTRYSLILFATLTMIVKIYFLCVIWKCYRYLRLIELVSPIRLSEIYPHIHSTNPQYPIVRVLGSADLNEITSAGVAPPPYESISSNMKPPNYEEAMKTSTLITPNHSAATTPTNHQQQPQQHTAVFSDPNSEQNRQNVSTHLVNGVSQLQASTNRGFVSDTLSSDCNSVDQNASAQVSPNSIDPQVCGLSPTGPQVVASDNTAGIQSSNEITAINSNEASPNIPKQNEK